jgi:hypothetical protein
MQSGGILIPPFVVRIFKSTVFLQIYVPLTPPQPSTTARPEAFTPGHP